jgi:hypothetical protein
MHFSLRTSKVQKYWPIATAQKDENFTKLAPAIKSCLRPGLFAGE